MLRVRKKSSLIFLLAIYILAGLLLIPVYKNQINPDGISYINISYYLLEGRYIDAINAFWNPLYSIFLTPFLLFFDKLSSTKVLSFVIGFFTLIGLRLLSNRYNLSKSLKDLLSLIIIPNLFYFAYSVVSADFLVLCFYIYYLYLVFEPTYYDKIGKAILIGLLGFFAYLARSYAFYFFIGHLSLISFTTFLRHASALIRKKIILSFVIGMTVFLILSSFWIGLVGLKYGKLSLGHEGGFVFASVAPDLKEPLFYNGLVKPVKNLDTSIWDDPIFLKKKSWSPLRSIDNLLYYLKPIYNNAHGIYVELAYFYHLSLPIVFGYLLYFLNLKNRSVRHRINLLTLLTFFLYPVGYILIYVEERFIWLNLVLVLFMGISLLQVVLNKLKFNALSRVLLLAIAVLFFTYYPIKKLVILASELKKGCIVCQTLEKEKVRNKNIASNHNWGFSLIYSFYSQSRYFGMTIPEADAQNILDELRRNNIEYYLVWGESNLDEKLKKNYQLIAEVRPENLKILKRKDIF